MPEEEHEGERVANLSSDHNVEGMEVTGMVQNAIKIMEKLTTLPESMPDQNNHDRGQGGVDNDMGLGETVSQPLFGLSVRVKPTLPKVGTWSPPGLSKTQSSIARVKSPRI
jgi:hypothetical protein